MNHKHFCFFLASVLIGSTLIVALLLFSSRLSSAQAGVERRTATIFPDAGYCFLQGLITPTTNLARSREGECFTTVYKNSLAAMAFIHQGDITEAEGIFELLSKPDHSHYPYLWFSQRLECLRRLTLPR